MTQKNYKFKLAFVSYTAFCHPTECLLLSRDLMNPILEKGHSRVPVYYEQPTNIIGLVLVCNYAYSHLFFFIPSVLNSHFLLCENL